MVVPDPQIELAPHKITATFYPASPYERVAATFFDLLVVLWPTADLLTAMLRAQVNLYFATYAFVNGMGLVMLLVVFVAAMVIAYYLVANYFYGRSIGQWIMGLKLRSLRSQWPGEKPQVTFEQALVRAMVSVLSLGLFGGPWLSSFVHPRFWAWQDLLSETELLSQSDHSVYTRMSQSTRLVYQRLQWVLIFMPIVMVLWVLTLFLRSDHQQKSLWRSSEEDACAAISKIINQNRYRHAQPEPSRLDIAWLLATGPDPVADDCLWQEMVSANLNQTDHVQSALIQMYLTQDASIKNEYFQKVCQKSQEFCTLAQLINAVGGEVADDQSYNRLSAVAADYDKLPRSIVSAMWAMRLSFTKGYFEMTKKYTDLIRHHTWLAPELTEIEFLTEVQSGRILAAQKLHAARLVGTFASEEAPDFSNDIAEACLWSLWHLGCDAIHSSQIFCTEHRDHAASKSQAEDDLHNALAQRIWQCVPDPKNSTWAKLIAGYQPLAIQFKTLQSMDLDESQVFLRTEILNQLLKQKIDYSELLNLARLWRIWPSTPQWRQTGRDLLRATRHEKQLHAFVKNEIRHRTEILPLEHPSQGLPIAPPLRMPASQDRRVGL